MYKQLIAIVAWQCIHTSMPGLMVVMFLGVLGSDSDRQILQSTSHFTGHALPDAGDHHPRGHREIRG